MFPLLNLLCPEEPLGRTVPMIHVNIQNGQEALILEHMKQHGFGDAKNKRLGLDFNHVCKLLDWLAKLHGLSYTLLQKDPKWIEKNPTFRPIMFRIPPQMRAEMKKFRKFFPVRCQKIADAISDGTGHNNYSAWMKDAFERGLDFDVVKGELQTPRENEFNAINHLDPWFNNALFKVNFKFRTPIVSKKIPRTSLERGTTLLPHSVLVITGRNPWSCTFAC